MQSVCVFCGSSLGIDPRFREVAETLGQQIARTGRTLVYGGSNVGLMGIVADAALEAGGRVVGVLPEFLAAKEIAHKGLTELILCESMHQRKTKMFELSEGFIALPGGFGTLEEISEILTWAQLGLHRFPVVFLNVDGFYDPIKQQFDRMTKNGVLKQANREMALFAPDVASSFEMMEAYEAPEVEKWLSRPST